MITFSIEHTKIWIILLVLLAFQSGMNCTEKAETSKTPDSEPLLFIEGDALVSLGNPFEKRNPYFLRATDSLLKSANQALVQGPFSVMEKSVVPPSGDKHDYMSQGPYWWPDPSKPDGLPYIRRDGEVNPEREQLTDRSNLNAVMRNSEILSKAWILTADEKYAAKAAELIRVWFLNAETRMNPNLNFGQGIPGRTKGRGIGIIETRMLAMVMDAATLIRSSKSWTDKDEAELKAWCRDYLDWLLHSSHGKDEVQTKNNHGTWYDVQTAALAIYTDQPVIARELFEKAKGRRLDAHILPDGSQPQELARTRSWDYSCMNLWGLFLAARLAKHVEVDLWQYPTAKDSQLKKALDYLLPFALGKKSWLHEQIRSFDPTNLIPHLQVANRVFPEQGYDKALKKLLKRNPDFHDYAYLWY